MTIITSEWEQYTSGFYGKFVLWIPASPSIGAEALEQGIVTHNRRSPIHHVTPFPLSQAPCVLPGVGDDERSMDLEDNECGLSGASQAD